MKVKKIVALAVGLACAAALALLAWCAGLDHGPGYCAATQPGSMERIINCPQ